MFYLAYNFYTSVESIVSDYKEIINRNLFQESYLRQIGLNTQICLANYVTSYRDSVFLICIPFNTKFEEKAEELEKGFSNAGVKLEDCTEIFEVYEKNPNAYNSWGFSKKKGKDQLSNWHGLFTLFSIKPPKEYSPTSRRIIPYILSCCFRMFSNTEDYIKRYNNDSSTSSENIYEHIVNINDNLIKNTGSTGHALSEISINPKYIQLINDPDIVNKTCEFWEKNYHKYLAIENNSPRRNFITQVDSSYRISQSSFFYFMEKMLNESKPKV